MTTDTAQQRPSLAVASDPRLALDLAANFKPNADLVVTEGLACFGVKGSAFEPGRAIIVLPNGQQIKTTFHQRESQHTSHTPTVSAALARLNRTTSPLV